VGIVAWIVFGLLAGAVARLLVPGRHGIGCLGTLAVGVVGALIGGFLGQLVLGREVQMEFALGPFLLAVLGAVLFLLLLSALVGGRRRRL
jgi:uncharacterized membrane protein YeaQ/YmgE (transglycosylase-associated protein family)